MLTSFSQFGSTRDTSRNFLTFSPWVLSCLLQDIQNPRTLFIFSYVIPDKLKEAFQKKEILGNFSKKGGVRGGGYLILRLPGSPRHKAYYQKFYHINLRNLNPLSPTSPLDPRLE